MFPPAADSLEQKASDALALDIWRETPSGYFVSSLNHLTVTVLDLEVLNFTPSLFTKKKACLLSHCLIL